MYRLWNIFARDLEIVPGHGSIERQTAQGTRRADIADHLSCNGSIGREGDAECSRKPRDLCDGNIAGFQTKVHFDGRGVRIDGAVHGDRRFPELECC